MSSRAHAWSRWQTAFECRFQWAIEDTSRKVVATVSLPMRKSKALLGGVEGGIVG